MSRYSRREDDVICAHCEEPTPGTIEHRFLDNPSDVYQPSDVIGLAKAIGRGDIAEAKVMLTRVFRNDEIVREWISQGFASA